MLNDAGRVSNVARMLVAALVVGSAGSAALWADETPLAGAKSVDLVAPIDWSRFHPMPELPEEQTEELSQAAAVLLNCMRYNMAWAERSFKQDEHQRRYLLTKLSEHGIRPATSAGYSAAVVLKTGAFDADRVGVSRDEAIKRTVKLIRGAAATHKANRHDGDGWGDQWQSALWAAQCGFGGWLLWQDLDAPAQRQLVAMVQHEANRFIAEDYVVPYWDGKDGNTKAEENSWNSMILNVAVAMMPGHTHARQWKAACSELMISSYAREQDWRENEAIVDGRRVKDWLDGYNVRADGAVMNHNMLHPDYMVAISMNFWGLTTHSLAGRTVPESWDFNGAMIYRTCVSQAWKSPPHAKPGGTIYRVGEADVYYPGGLDWSTEDVSLFYLMDVYARLFDWHDGAADWMRLRAAKMLAMQQRHDDRRMFAAGEYDTYGGAEQWIAWCLADAYLPLWLSTQQTAAGRSALAVKGNWLAR